uniref:Uncharacterized protein n=1 Tax=Arundo donax TaxID=35708 RepID=A0A0A9FJ70_ARUDO
MCKMKALPNSRRKTMNSKIKTDTIFYHCICLLMLLVL